MSKPTPVAGVQPGAGTRMHPLDRRPNITEEDALPVALMFADELRNDARGVAILYEWLGAGGTPVSLARANDRALVCLDCPHNHKARWWETAKEAIAYAIQRHLSVKNKLNLKVNIEDDIGMCRACGCCLRLKVHVPIEHVANHLPDGAMGKFPSHCWMKQEIELL